MTEGVTGHFFGNFAALCGCFDRSLKCASADVMALGVTISWVDGSIGGWEDKLPDPVMGGVWIFFCEGMG